MFVQILKGICEKIPLLFPLYKRGSDLSLPCKGGGTKRRRVFMLKYNGELTILARNLRKNMTKEECKLWYNYLRNCKCRFLRQKIIDNYIVDFYSPKKQIVIELDGGQHYEDTAKQKDQERDSYLKSLGLTVLRYTNVDINKNFEDVCADIERYL